MIQYIPSQKGLLKKTKAFLRQAWQVYLDMPIFSKITLMLGFCLFGYIIIGLYYGNVIKEIKQDLNSINKTQAEMFNTSRMLMSHIEVVRQNLNILTKPSATPDEKEAAVRNMGDHLDKLAAIITSIINEKTHHTDIETAATDWWNSALHISIRNAIENIDRHRKKLEEFFNNSNTNGVDASRFLADQAEEIEKNLRVIEVVSSKNIESTVHYIKKGIEQINQQAEWKARAGVMIMALVMLTLIIASYTWGKFLVGPLRMMARSLRTIRSSTTSSDGCSSIETIPVTGNDEIGEVACATNKLLQHMRNICHFRRTIESDETVNDVYRRLGLVFKRQLGLTSFVIFEILRENDKMVAVYIEPPGLEHELAEINICASKCRAFRTGSFITSFQDEGICPIFSWPDALTHACIPMHVGGEILGIIQFLFPFVNNREREEAFKNAVLEAKFYLMEAMPVIKSKLLAQTLRESATKDPTTLLLNRRYLEMNLDRIVASVRRSKGNLGILMCDIDYFKQVNDQFGHDTGDMVLLQFAKIIKQHARESDYAIRFGGEEFLLLLVDCEPGFAEHVAERLRKAVEEYVFRFPGMEFNKTISIGISEFPGDTDMIWEAIKFADVALYEAKNRGRNRVVRFNADMWQNASF